MLADAGQTGQSRTAALRQDLGDWFIQSVNNHGSVAIRTRAEQVGAAVKMAGMRQQFLRNEVVIHGWPPRNSTGVQYRKSRSAAVKPRSIAANCRASYCAALK